MAQPVSTTPNIPPDAFAGKRTALRRRGLPKRPAHTTVPVLMGVVWMDGPMSWGYRPSTPERGAGLWVDRPRAVGVTCHIVVRMPLKDGFDREDALEVLRQAAEDARADDALTPEDINPPFPDVTPGAPIGGPHVRAYRKWKDRQRFLGRSRD